MLNKDKIKEQVCGSELRENIRQAIIRKYGEDPEDRFRIIKSIGDVVEVMVRWDLYDSEILSVKINGQNKKVESNKIKRVRIQAQKKVLKTIE